MLLLLLRVYTKEELANLSPSELSEKLDALWDDVLALQKSDPVQVSDKPAAPKQTGLLDFILPGKHTAPSHLKVAFVHERTPSTSSWTSQHEFGRTQLDTVFEGKVETAATSTPSRARTPMPLSSRPSPTVRMSSLRPAPSW